MADDKIASEFIATEDAVNPDYDTAMASMRGSTDQLIAKARALVDMLDDAERNHGALIGSKTLTAANELRIELSRWK